MQRKQNQQDKLSGLQIIRSQSQDRRRDVACVECFYIRTSETLNPFQSVDTGISSWTLRGSPENPAEQGIMKSVEPREQNC